MKRKTKISPIDRIILSTMLDSGCAGNRWLSTNEIVEQSELVNWKTVHKHLLHLKKSHYVISRNVGEVREYERDNKKVKSARKIEWTLNVKKK